MKRCCFALFIALPFILYANSGWRAKVGGNYTHIETSSCLDQNGFVLGIGRDWHLWRPFYISSDVLLTLKRADLKNKRIHFYPGCIYTYDIQCSYRFIEVPVMLKTSIPLLHDFEIYLLCGPSLALGTSDNSSIKIREDGYALSPGEYENAKMIEYDYSEIYDPGPLWPYRLANSPIGFNLGIGAKLSRYEIEMRYQRSSIYTARTTGALIRLEEAYSAIYGSLSVTLGSAAK